MLDPVTDVVVVAHLDSQDDWFTQVWEANIEFNLKILWPDHFLQLVNIQLSFDGFGAGSGRAIGALRYYEYSHLLR